MLKRKQIVHMLITLSLGGLALGAAADPATPHLRAAPTTAGDLDPTFGGYGLGGRVIGDVFPGTTIRDAITLPDDRIVAAGSDGADFIVACYFADGRIDPSFGVGGVARVDFSGKTDLANAVAGYAGPSREVQDFAVAMYQRGAAEPDTHRVYLPLVSR